ncbi:MAG: glycoside hydrolase family 2 TIM barrel-domain containing protein [Sphingomicrobium sp.]
MSESRCQFLVALDQCGLELQGPHMVTSAKRLIKAGDVDAASLGQDSLRYHAWDPVAVCTRYDGLDPNASYEVEARFACERLVPRRMALVAGGVELTSFDLDPGGKTIVCIDVPSSAVRDGVLDLRIECRAGPDAMVSELRLFSSSPVPPDLTVVGDSRGGIIGSVFDAGFAGVPGAEIVVSWTEGKLTAVSDARGMFRIPLREMLPHGQHRELTVVARSGGLETVRRIDTRTLAQGLRELPEPASRLDLAGDWLFVPGRWPDPLAPDWRGAKSTHVPGHVALDGLIPEAGVATLRRTISIPAGWNGGAVFARFDGAYGRAEVFVNGAHAGTHSAGTTSFDVDISALLRAGENDLTIVLTECTAHAVLDYMSWYAHTSLLGLWREALLFRVNKLHLGPTTLLIDWDPSCGDGSVDVATEIINLDPATEPYTLHISLFDGESLLHRTTLSGPAPAAGSVRRAAALHLPDVEPWSAEIPRLYSLELSLQSGSLRPESYGRRIGFRRVETRGNQLLVNGAPIRLLGVNRHDARMRSGRAMRYEDLRHDVLALRRANVNIIRTAHYPADPRLLELCDELGMYVQDQMPICFAAGFDDHHWTRTNDAAHLVPFVLEVTAETVGRDQGYPSVLIWDLANETQWGWGFDEQLALVRGMDPGRPTLFSFDLNQLGDVNPLPHMPRAARPDIRTYHYPGWDRSWQEDIDWLRSYDQPVVLDECMPPFQDNARAPLHAELLHADPGLRDYWVTGARPFMARAMEKSGCIGGMIWSAVDDQWTLPIDESVGFGHWSHLTRLDYYRVRDVHPPQGGRYFRGEGEWGLLDGWGRPRPELWHVQKMYSPIEIKSSQFSADGQWLDLTIVNRHSHRALESLELSTTGAVVATRSSSPSGGAFPGCCLHLRLEVSSDASHVELQFRHPEGWLVDAFGWDVPGRVPDPHVAVRASSEVVQVALDDDGNLSITGGQQWIATWPRIHVVDANSIIDPTSLPRADLPAAVAGADGSITVPLTGSGWDGRLTVRANGGEAVFDYKCHYSGEEAFDAHEIGLAFELRRALDALWWDRRPDWSFYPERHIGRRRGYAAASPKPADPLQPASLWEDDATESGTNDYRSTKRCVLAAGATDGQRSVTIVGNGSQHVRASLSPAGSAILRVLDWYGGVPLRLDTDHIWTSNFGTGKRIARGTTLQGQVRMMFGTLPEGVRTYGRSGVDAKERRP